MRNLPEKPAFMTSHTTTSVPIVFSMAQRKGVKETHARLNATQTKNVPQMCSQFFSQIKFAHPRTPKKHTNYK